MRKHLPIYGVRFGQQDVLSLLSEYLETLEIAQAKSVQIVADGAAWIWHDIKAMLLQAGVQGAAIVETLDYAHASEYVSKIIQKLPASTSVHKKSSLRAGFLGWLWEGEALKIVQECKVLFKRPCQELQPQRGTVVDKVHRKTQRQDAICSL